MKKIIVASFKHETDSFCPVPAFYHTRQNLYDNRELFEKYRGVKNELGGFIDVFGAREDVELIPVINYNASPSGPVPTEIFDEACAAMTRAVAEQGVPDAFLLALHGAQVVDDPVYHADGEGDFIAHIRSIAGPDVPIAVSLDLHANITQKMADLATILLPYEKYPHIDTYDTAVEVAKMLADLLDGTFRPAMAYRRVPYLLPMFPTELEEIRPFYKRAEEMMELPGVREVRISHGFYPSDISEMGMAVIAITDGDQELSESLAAELAGMIWDAKDTLVRTFPDLEEVLDRIDPAVSEEAEGEGPLVIADASDNPGGGGLSDTTFILRRVLERGIEGGALASIVDPECVKMAKAAGVGAKLVMDIGGKSDPAFSGGPIRAEVTVEYLTTGAYRNRDEMVQGMEVPIGDTAVVNAGGNHIILTSLKTQPYDAEIFRYCGIAPEKARFLIVKSAVHYRNSYRKFARETVEVMLPGYVVPVPDGLPFRHW